MPLPEVKRGPILANVYRFKINGFPFKAIAAVIWTLLFGKSHPLDLDGYFHAHFDLLMNGLKARPKAAD